MSDSLIGGKRVKRIPLRPFYGWVRADAVGNAFGFVEPFRECCKLERGEVAVYVEVREVIRKPRKRRAK